MTFRQFAFNNIFRNKRIYAAHFLSSAFSIMIFFTYALLLFHPDLQGELKSTSATISAFGTLGFTFSQGLIFVFSFFFILYSVSSFLKTRKKEFGILMMQGMSMRQLKKLLLIENMLIGFGSICIGILIGLVFSKLVLLISASVLMISNGLSFYIPVQALLLTVITFLLLFLIVSLVTFKMVKVTELVELIQAEAKPKPEPKASILLSLFSLISIGYGYFSVFRFISNYNFITLGMGVLLVIIGTYFLYTQCSVYILHLAKRSDSFFLKRTNILTFSELIYRMKDNATMFFIVSIISAVAFTAIGTTAALGNKDLVRMTNPYTFLYTAPDKNKIADKHLSIIKKHLADANIPYRMASSSYIYTESNVYVMKLSEYNELARALGYQQETIEKEDEMLLIPGMVSQKQEFKNGDYKKNIEVIQGDWTKTFHVKKTVDNLVLPHDTNGIYIAVQDHVYDGIPLISHPIGEDGNDGVDINFRTYGFVVDDWIKTKEISNQLKNIFDKDPREIHLEFRALTIELLSAKQTNGLLLMASVLVGIVFFTFAASFIYFRLYTDLDRDQQQYKMISKMGLSKRELKKVVTRQLLLMFFLPIVVAVIHTVVAFMALQQLVDFSIINSSIIILISFICIQVLYFFITRWRYLQKLYKTMEQ
ncbi:ABC transporter permease [Bacillus sp. LK2]|uniref:ABC transporter permease n=1 Tax=Bacillus sp. LK2 TaxID=1628206 RepID=UPI000653A819|nr:ABC transporter permease [Bacillus sp. LK2]KMN45952.1 ABC transporter permease [Bacillus sp. LK2]